MMSFNGYDWHSFLPDPRIGLRAVLLPLLLLIASSTLSENAQPWLTLPPTPSLPQSEQQGYIDSNHSRIWYSEFGEGEPIVLLHGGFANADYFGNLIRTLATRYRVIAIDSRGQGRSDLGSEALTYALMETDIIHVMDHLSVQKAAVIGWSDGAILGLKLAIDHPNRLTRVFAFAANTRPNAIKDTSKSTVFNEFLKRTQQEYKYLSPTPQSFPALRNAITRMWRTQPDITQAQLMSIQTPVWIVDGQYDEAVQRQNQVLMAQTIPAATLVIIPDTSHFAFLQNPPLFDCYVLAFLAEKLPVTCTPKTQASATEAPQ
ncbi:AB hydrolase superfamily protein YdjP [BD1-7 clade bacterium]|uniref:AB hydrolase superfamily protein YdjP n=1 Tax=BD1-7 clade bacterium TaxID=2029982 RepID=A0A5S9NSA7_9GAMM|nr:AB hydrolase superfamily protein YdjP [BD1-7 clade bacterium]CAA0093520.1 AB hydrolase superfamily protein YdjP [BD1-7 clade bacterium]